jgi:two-component system response regulator YesN
MAILSKRTLTEVIRTCHQSHGLRPRLMDLNGRIVAGNDPLAAFSRIRRERAYALHESVNLGIPFIFALGPVITSWVIALEDQRIIHAALIGGEVLVTDRAAARGPGIEYLTGLGLTPLAAAAYLDRLPVWPPERVESAGIELETIFYRVSGWKPILLPENRLRLQQQKQIAEAIEDQKKRGESNAYPFEKERILLSLIRAGDPEGARRVLNEMLAAMYMSSPRLALLRARAIEMMGYLTRAAIEDSPALEPLIERNHQWMERLIRARDFEDLSHVLTGALNDFIEGIYVHGFNRTNTHVARALDYIRRDFAKPLTLADAAREVGLSPYRIAHLIKNHTGKTFIQILHEIRIQRARTLLEETDQPCTEIAYEVGFGDQSYFIKHFRRLTGITPARYRRGRRT